MCDCENEDREKFVYEFVRSARETDLKKLFDEYKICNKCSLYKTRTQIVFSRGDVMSEIAWVSEAPGATEDRLGKPFVGRSGKLLDNMILAMGYSPEQVYICNACLCRPPNNRKPTPEEIKCCNERLVEQLDIISPKIIIALGGSAADALLGPGMTITARRKGFHYFNNIPVKATYHPAYCLRNPKAKVDVWEDLKSVMEFLKKDTKEG
jgi:uracil-DNA glycosylase